MPASCLTTAGLPEEECVKRASFRAQLEPATWHAPALSCAGMPCSIIRMSQSMPEFSGTYRGEPTYGFPNSLCTKVNFRCIATTMCGEICCAGRYFLRVEQEQSTTAKH